MALNEYDIYGNPICHQSHFGLFSTPNKPLFKNEDWTISPISFEGSSEKENSSFKRPEFDINFNINNTRKPLEDITPIKKTKKIEMKNSSVNFFYKF